MSMVYLNRSGTRWKDTAAQQMKFELVDVDGTRKRLTAHCWEQFGNFAVLVFRYKGQQHKKFVSDHERTADEHALPVVYMGGVKQELGIP